MLVEANQKGSETNLKCLTKTYSQKMSAQGNVLVGKCPVGEFTVGEVSGIRNHCWESIGNRGSLLGIYPRGIVSRATVRIPL